MPSASSGRTEPRPAEVGRPLAGRVAVVTGSTSGIGLAVATALAGQGCAVMLNGFGEAAAVEAVRAGLAAEHATTVLHHPADVARPSEIEALMDEAARSLGPVDILVNNAGIQHTDPVERFPVAAWDAVLAINLSAAFHTIRRAVPAMRQRGWGRIVNIASAHGLVASAEKAAYVAAKHGLVGLTKVVALEAAGTGVTCNAVCPGWVRTPLVERQIEARAAAQEVTIEAAARSLLRDKQPSGRFVTPEQVAAMVLYLASEAAAEVTGAALSIDGGWTAQ